MLTLPLKSHGNAHNFIMPLRPRKICHCHDSKVYKRLGREGKSGLFCTNSLIFPKNGSVHR